MVTFAAAITTNTCVGVRGRTDEKLAGHDSTGMFFLWRILGIAAVSAGPIDGFEKWLSMALRN